MKAHLEPKIVKWTKAGVALIRWVIFIPAALVAGGTTFFVIMGLVDSLTAQSRPGGGDREFLSLWGVSAELISGFLSILIGMLMAPRGKRIIAVNILAVVCVIVTGILTDMAMGMDDPDVRLYPAFGWMIFGASVVITSVVICRLEKRQV